MVSRITSRALNVELRVLDMNAFGNPIGSSGGVQREQTMEEILASIRKIIESNEAIVGAQGDLADNETHYDEPEPVIDPLQTTVIQPVHIEVPEYLEPAVHPAAAPVASLQSEMARLVSQSPERRVAAAFDDLNTAFVKAKQMPMEDMAEAMLRPMLKDWLDNNLPNLVERLVREEISRIARGDI
jgi:uncharacterized protein